jgi:radical SAM/Cys-rich protein
MRAMTLPSLKSRMSDLASAERQLAMVAGADSPALALLERFEARLERAGLHPLMPTGIETLQVNVGKLCNQACKHCHVDAGPDRREVMSRDTLEACLAVLRRTPIPTVDITGGAPELNPHFRWFVAEAAALGKHVMVRCNLTVILANPSYRELPDFYREHLVHVVSSLPYYEAGFTDRQRGAGVFERSIQALRMLNAVGYGRPGSGLLLDLVYNPAGAFLPAPQAGLEADFKRELSRRWQIGFNRLYAITNMPISRFLDYLRASGNLQGYMERLAAAFNPAAAQGVMCRSLLSVGWDGLLYDCDFNQMLDLPVETRGSRHIRDFDLDALDRRAIVLGQHCYGCTAGAGSSCGGEIA